NPMRGHEIERLLKIGQGSLPLNLSDDPSNVEQVGGRSEKRLTVGVESEDVVSEMLAHVKEVTCARAKVENAEWSRPIEPEILRPLDVDIDPIDDVFEAIDLWRARAVRVFVPQPLKLQPVNVVQYPALVDGMGRPAEMFEDARKELGRKKFPE